MTAGQKSRQVRISEGYKAAMGVLAERPGGRKLGELSKDLGRPPENVANMLWRMKASGLVISVGAGTQTIWGLPEHLAHMGARLRRLKKLAHARMRKRENERGAVYRAIKGKRKTVSASACRPIDRPAVNSVWSLAR